MQTSPDWLAILAIPDPPVSALEEEVAAAGMPDLQSYHELVARLSLGPLPYPLRNRRLPPGSKVETVAWAYQLIERQKASHRAWSRRQAKGPFRRKRRLSPQIKDMLARERSRKYTATYRAKVRKELEGIRKWDAPTSGKMIKRRRRHG